MFTKFGFRKWVYFSPAFNSIIFNSLYNRVMNWLKTWMLSKIGQTRWKMDSDGRKQIPLLLFSSFYWFTVILLVIFHIVRVNDAAVQPLSLVNFSFAPIPPLSSDEQFSRNERTMRISRQLSALSVIPDTILLLGICAHEKAI